MATITQYMSVPCLYVSLFQLCRESYDDNVIITVTLIVSKVMFESVYAEFIQVYLLTKTFFSVFDEAYQNSLQLYEINFINIHLKVLWASHMLT